MPIANDRNKSALPVVGRAEYKIAEAAGAFGLDFREKTVLDVGSSTGGFTEYALRRGAKLVIAVEKGTNQMKAPLRYDEKVELHEKTDIFDFATKVKPDIVLADVSFISMRRVLDHVAKKIAGANTQYLIMLKPQFEAKPEQLNRGVVKNERMRREICRDFETWLKEKGFLIKGKRDNETVGRKGNRERFYWLDFRRG